MGEHNAVRLEMTGQNFFRNMPRMVHFQKDGNSSHIVNLLCTYPVGVEDDNFYNNDVDKMLYGVTSIYTVHLKIEIHKTLHFMYKTSFTVFYFAENAFMFEKYHAPC